MCPSPLQNQAHLALNKRVALNMATCESARIYVSLLLSVRTDRLLLSLALTHFARDPNIEAAEKRPEKATRDYYCPVRSERLAQYPLKKRSNWSIDRKQPVRPTESWHFGGSSMMASHGVAVVFNFTKAVDFKLATVFLNRGERAQTARKGTRASDTLGGTLRLAVDPRDLNL